jgi:hypothetical protein
MTPTFLQLDDWITILFFYEDCDPEMFVIHQYAIKLQIEILSDLIY